MPLYRTQVRLAKASGIPEDAVTNTFWCIADDVTALSGFTTQLGLFYGELDTFWSQQMATTGHTITSYDFGDPEPRAPVQVVTGLTLSLGSGSLPMEVALCLSFQAPRQSGTDQARRRGRVYLGPFDTASLDSSGGPAQAVYDAVTAAGQGLLDASQAATTWAWAVYSTVNQAAIEVTSAWVDNAWDTVRRRGTTANARAIIT